MAATGGYIRYTTRNSMQVTWKKGNNAYLLELPALENMLNTRKFLMDEISGQFYAVYGNSYQKMSTKPMLQQAWATGELIDELVATRQAFGYTGLAGSTPPLATGTQPTASTSQLPDDLLPRQPAPASIFQTYQTNNMPYKKREDTGTPQLHIGSL